MSVVGTLTYGIMGTYVLGQGFHPEIKDFTSASYFTFVTLSTMGYGDIVPVSPEARLFTTTLMRCGAERLCDRVGVDAWPCAFG